MQLDGKKTRSYWQRFKSGLASYLKYMFARQPIESSEEKIVSGDPEEEFDFDNPAEENKSEEKHWRDYGCGERALTIVGMPIGAAVETLGAFAPIDASGSMLERMIRGCMPRDACNIPIAAKWNIVGVSYAFAATFSPSFASLVSPRLERALKRFFAVTNESLMLFTFLSLLLFYAHAEIEKLLGNSAPVIETSDEIFGLEVTGIALLSLLFSNQLRAVCLEDRIKAGNVHAKRFDYSMMMASGFFSKAAMGRSLMDGILQLVDFFANINTYNSRLGITNKYIVAILLGTAALAYAAIYGRSKLLPSRIESGLIAPIVALCLVFLPIIVLSNLSQDFVLGMVVVGLYTAILGRGIYNQVKSCCKTNDDTEGEEKSSLIKSSSYGLESESGSESESEYRVFLPQQADPETSVLANSLTKAFGTHVRVAANEMSDVVETSKNVSGTGRIYAINN